MKTSKHLLRGTPVLTAIALAFPLFPVASFAQSTFSASGSYDVGGDTANGLSRVKSGSFTLPATTGAVAQSAVGSPTNYWDSTVSVSASASGDGHFGGAVFTQESYGSRSPMQTQVSMVYSDTLVNTSGAAQAASFTLDIDSLNFGFDYGTRSGKNAVSFSASVFVNGSNAPVWSTSFAYDNGWAAGTYYGTGSYTSSGQDIGLAAQLPSSCFGADPGSCIFTSGGFGISNYLTSIALGTVADGATIGIRYVVDIGTETNMYGGNASVTFNDPSNLQLGGATAALRFDGAAAPAVPAVPEPETYLMMAAGLGLLAAGTRRRRTR